MRFFSGARSTAGTIESKADSPSSVQRAVGYQGNGFAIRSTPYSGAWDTQRAVRDGYERDVWVYRCIDAISANASGLRVTLREGNRNDGKPVEDREPELMRLLNVRPNSYESATALRYRLFATLLLSRKGAFIEVVRTRGGKLAEFHMLPPHRVDPIRSATTFVSGYRVRFDDGGFVDLKPEQVCWIKAPHPLDPYASMTPTEAAGLSIDTDWYARMYNRSFLANDGRPGGLLGVRGGVSDEDAQELQRRFSGGPGMAGRTSVIEADDITWVDTAVTPRDAQYVQTRAISKEEILLAFGVPESVMGNASGRTFDNADAEWEIFWRATVLNKLTIVDNALDMLTAGADEDDLFVAHDTSTVSVLGRERRQEEDRMLVAVEKGTAAIDEWRDLAGMKKYNEPNTKALWKNNAPITGQAADEFKPPAAPAPASANGNGSAPPGEEVEVEPSGLQGGGGEAPKVLRRMGGDNAKSGFVLGPEWDAEHLDEYWGTKLGVLALEVAHPRPRAVVTVLDRGPEWDTEHLLDYWGTKGRFAIEVKKGGGGHSQPRDRLGRFARTGGGGPTPGVGNTLHDSIAGQTKLGDANATKLTETMDGAAYDAMQAAPAASRERHNSAKALKAKVSADLARDMKSSDADLDAAVTDICGLQGLNDQRSREENVSTLIHAWANTSNDSKPGSLAIQAEADAMFGVDNAMGWRTHATIAAGVKNIRADHGPVIRDFLQTQYDHTQKFLADAGISEVTVHRGMGVHPDSRLGEIASEALYSSSARARADNSSARLRPVSSFSTSRDNAVGFAEMRSGEVEGQGPWPTPILLTTTIPASRVFSTPATGAGCLGEREVIVLGGDVDVQVRHADVFFGQGKSLAPHDDITLDQKTLDDWEEIKRGYVRDRLGRFAHTGGGRIAPITAKPGTTKPGEDVENMMSEFSPATQKRMHDQLRSELDTDFDGVVENYDRMFTGATDAQRSGGKVWYDVASKEATKIAKDTGHTKVEVAGGIAALSPGAEWNSNVVKGRQMAEFTRDKNRTLDYSPAQLKEINKTLVAEKQPPIKNGVAVGTLTHQQAGIVCARQNHWALRSYDGPIASARIMRGEHPDAVLAGPKVRSFYNLIMHPKSSKDVAVDSHMIDAAAGQLITSGRTMSAITSNPSSRGRSLGLYPLLGDAVRAVAARHPGYTPAQVQATIWLRQIDQHPMIEHRRQSSANKAYDKLMRSQGRVFVKPFIRDGVRIPGYWYRP